MSGIYISGMEMPKSCWYCYFQDCGNCVLNNHKVVDNCIIEDRRDADCPLISVPDHGRLGDLNALKYRATKRLYASNHGSMAEAYFSAVIDLIDTAPAIIPADDQKEE
jgi:hypothetical protein